MPNDEKDQQSSVGQYYLVEKIARGGMAEIFKGLSYDSSGLKKTVCIKKILPDISASREFIDALIDEAKIAVTLSHGNIAQIFDLGRVGDDYFIVMEYVDGKTLSQTNRKAKKLGSLIPIPTLCYIISEALSGLDYIHRRIDENGKPLNIVHRDISPQNIMISYSGTVKIIDFGIAKAAISLGVTDTGILKGKFSYMSPEQSKGEPLDNRSDVFSLGVVFYQLLTGTTLFKAEDSRETLRNVRKAHVIPPSQLRPELPEELDKILMKSLAKERVKRYAGASDMRDDLLRFLYSSYPEYKTSEISSYMRGLFADEIETALDTNPLDNTPAQIIEGTHSALGEDKQEEKTNSVIVPIDIKKFIPYEKDDDKNEKEDLSQEDASDTLEAIKVAEERTLSFIKNKWKIILSVFVVFSVLAFAGIGFYKSSKEAPMQVVVELDKVGDLTVQTKPVDATVLLNGEEKGSKSPVVMKGLKAGNYVLKVVRDGYVTYENTIEVENNNAKTIDVDLEVDTQMFATVEINSTPPGATVYIDDIETSHKTPTVLKGIETNKNVTIGISLPGYLFWKKSFKPKAGETRNLEVNMVRNFASFYIQSNPSGALVMIQGAPVGETPWRGTNIEPGNTYTIEVWKEGYKSLKSDFKPEAGKEIRWEAILERSDKKNIGKPSQDIQPQPQPEQIVKPELQPQSEIQTQTDLNAVKEAEKVVPSSGESGSGLEQPVSGSSEPESSIEKPESSESNSSPETQLKPMDAIEQPGVQTKETE